MNKKTVPFLLAIPSFMLLLVFRVIPAMISLQVSTKNYSIMKGVSGSPGVGLQNYIRVIGSAPFAGVIANTVRLSLLPIIMTCCLALLMIFCISSMPNRIMKTIALVIIAIPSFLPVMAYEGIFFRVLSTDGLVNSILGSMGMEPVFFMANQSLFSLIFTVMDSLRNVFIPVLIGVLVCEKEGFMFDRVMLALLAYALVRATLFMSPDAEILLATANPMVYQKSDVIDTLVYRNGLVQMRLSEAGAMWVMKTAVQLVINIAVFFILSWLLPKLKGMANTLTGKVNKGTAAIISVPGYILLAAGSIGIIIALFFPMAKKYPGNSSLLEGIRVLLSNGSFQQSFILSLITCIIGSILYAFITLSLALPMTAGTKAYPLILVAVMAITNNTIGEFLFYRGIGMFGTIFPVIFSTITVAGAFALHFTVSNKFENGVPELKDYLKASLLPLLALVVLFFIGNWGGYLHETIFTTNRQLFGMGLLGRELMSAQSALNSVNANAGEGVKAAYVLLSSIVPAVLGSLLIALNRFIPLSAFSAQARKG